MAIGDLITWGISLRTEEAAKKMDALAIKTRTTGREFNQVGAFGKFSMAKIRGAAQQLTTQMVGMNSSVARMAAGFGPWGVAAGAAIGIAVGTMKLFRIEAERSKRGTDRLIDSLVSLGTESSRQMAIRMLELQREDELSKTILTRDVDKITAIEQEIHDIRFKRSREWSEEHKKRAEEEAKRIETMQQNADQILQALTLENLAIIQGAESASEYAIRFRRDLTPAYKEAIIEAMRFTNSLRETKEIADLTNTTMRETGLTLAEIGNAGARSRGELELDARRTRDAWVDALREIQNMLHATFGDSDFAKFLSFAAGASSIYLNFRTSQKVGGQ